MNPRIAGVFVSSFIVPWVLLIAAWKSSSARAKHWLITVFITIYGATITIAYDPSAEGADGVRHLLDVYTHYVGLNFDQFMSELWLILQFKSAGLASEDVLKHTLSYLAGGVLGMPKLFFPMVAFIYGYFFAGSLLEVFKYLRSTRLTFFFVAIAAIFFLTKNIEGVNTVRTWTGMWILVYACLKYYSTRKTRYILLMFVPPFIHFGFLIMAIPAWLVLLFGNWPRVFALLFVLSSFTTFFNPGTVVDVLSTTELGEERTYSYYREDRGDRQVELEERHGDESRIWLTLNRIGLQKWALNILVYTLLLTGVYFAVMSAYQKFIFSIGLLTVTLSNMTWYLYAVSNRSWVIGCVFILASFLMTRQDPTTARQIPFANPAYKIGTYLSLFLFIPFLSYNLSAILDFPSVFLLAAPFMVWISPEINMSMKEALKILLGVL